MNYPVITIAETSISVWEEKADDTLYGRVFLALVSFLQRSGWKVSFDQTTRGPLWFRRKYRMATKGELYASLHVAGRMLEVEFWQERYNVDNPHGGRYDFRKRSRMPPMLLRRCDLETIRLIEWLAERTGYRVEDRRYLRESVDARIARDIESSGHYRPDLSSR